MRRFYYVFLSAIPLAACATWVDRTFSLPEPPRPIVAQIPTLHVTKERTALAIPERQFTAEVATYDDELFAYLITSYLRGTATFEHWEVLLTTREAGGRLRYPVVVRSPVDDVAAGLYTLYTAKARGLIRTADWQWSTNPAVRGFRRQNHVFELAYHLPVQRPLESLTRPELIRYARRFVRFKSASDPRTWRSGVASLEPLSTAKSAELSADIVAVAEFFSLPLDLFMGIAAMENNYMNAPGDIHHAVWKPRESPGDIVLRRRGGSVLVSNYSVGVWQITRETLRHAQRLYLQDRRDYSRLAVELRPPRSLDLDAVSPRVLTTYAGLLFRELLDRCRGDIDCAVGAYNGGLSRPNYLYARGVKAAAMHARDVIEHAARLNAPAALTQFLAGPYEDPGEPR